MSFHRNLDPQEVKYYYMPVQIEMFDQFSSGVYEELEQIVQASIAECCQMV